MGVCEPFVWKVNLRNVANLKTAFIPWDNQIKKTVRLNGHTTSLALEKEFWKELNIIASNQSLSLNELVEKIDTLERKGSLASSIRVFILKTLRDK